jgi:ATP-dependent RNA helicase TDRD9
MERQTLCLAAELYYEQESEQVKLRETTLFPNVPGMPVLLALMFAPTVEIRRDADKTRYTTILAGLGADDENLAYYETRDALLNIDFDLKSSDLNTINNLRFAISKLFFIEPHTNMKVPSLNDGQREKLLRRIKELMLKIMTVKREPREIDEAGRIFEWKNESDVEKLAKFGHIYEFIAAPPIVEMSMTKKKKLLDHANDLEWGGYKYEALYHQECRLCNVLWENREDLKIHLLSTLHKKRKEHLIKSLEEE